MNKKSKKSIVVIIILLIFIGYSKNVLLVDAASAMVKLDVENKSVIKGDTVSISLKIGANEAIGDFETTIYYDSDLLEFKTSGNLVSGGDGVLRLTDTNVEEESNTRKYIISFKALKSGVTEIKTGDNTIIYNFDGKARMSVSTQNLMIDIANESNINDTKDVNSTNAKLQSLKISPGTLKPNFNSSITAYTASVENDVERIIVGAKAENKNASIFVKGDTKFKEGSNKVVVTVQSESGNAKEYIISVTRKQVATKKPIATENSEETKETQKPSSTNFDIDENEDLDLEVEEESTEFKKYNERLDKLAYVIAILSVIIVILIIICIRLFMKVKGIKDNDDFDDE